MEFHVPYFILAVLSVLLTTPVLASDDTTYDLNVDGGFLAVLNHRIQFSENNTYFNYVEDGGQDVLFAYQRLTGEMGRAGDYRLKFVYQPIDLRTSNVLEEELRVDNVVFPVGTPMDFRYSFPYYRGTYLWNIMASDSFELYGGLGLQIRNATIEFKSASGDQYVASRDVGPVPLFAVAGLYKFSAQSVLDFEAEGNYANTAFINGDDESAVRGAIFDAAVAWRRVVSKKMSVLARVRYVSGGAEGTSDEEDNATSDGYNSNWIDLLAVNAGLTLHLDHW